MTCDIEHFRDLDRLLPATRTTRPDIARSHLAAIFADHDLRLSAGRVDFSHQQAKLCDAAIGLLRYGAEVEVVAPALDCYMAQLTLDGEVAFRTGRWAGWESRSYQRPVVGSWSKRRSGWDLDPLNVSACIAYSSSRPSPSTSPAISESVWRSGSATDRGAMSQS